MSKGSIEHRKDQHNGADRVFLMRCIERYLHAAQICYLDGANELARLYFSPARSEAAGASKIDDIEARVKEALEALGEEQMYNHVQRFTQCAKEGLRNQYHSIEQKFWHAIDDIVEADLMMDAMIPNSLKNPQDLIERIKKEYNRIAPLNNGVGSPEHSARYNNRGGKE